MNSKTFFVTGGAGYIGSHAVLSLLQQGHRVVVFDNLSRGYKEPIQILERFGELEFIQGDIRNRDDCTAALKRHHIDAVLHFAAFCSVDESMKDPALYFDNNTFGSFSFFESMRECDVRTIIFSSTCATYGEAERLPVDENHPQRPTNPYGESKLLVEKMLRWYGEVYGFAYVILRYFNVCGAHDEGLIGDSKRPSVLLVQNAVRGAVGLEPFSYTCPLVSTPDGTPIRDYIDVRDLIDGHLLALKYVEEGGKSDVFCLGSGNGYSVKEIVTEVESIFGVQMPKVPAEPRKGEYAAVYANAQKAKDILHWTPKRSIRDSVLALKKWYEKRPRGYDF